MPAGEVRARWAWAEAEVGTERLWTALEPGVRGGQWFSWMDQVDALPNRRQAFARGKANGGAAGGDPVTVKDFECPWEENLEKLSRALEDGSYRPQAIRRVWIPKPGSKEKRPLGIPTVRDRVAPAALRAVLEPIFERDFAAHRYGFRPKRGCQDALRRVDTWLENGYGWVVDADRKSYFDTMPHSERLERVHGKVVDSKVLGLVNAYLKAKGMETAQGWEPEQGTPPGAVIRPLLPNVDLNPLEHPMAEPGYEMARYADDCVILCRSEAEAKEALEQVQQCTAAAGRQLHPVKTRIVNAPQGGFDFLGYHCERGYRWPRRQSLQKLKDTVRTKTRRTNGHSLPAIITALNRTWTGWFEYCKPSSKSTFDGLDRWVRFRLRSILRKRRGWHGCARGWDNVPWPPAYFAQLGWFSFVAAHASASQSSRR